MSDTPCILAIDLGTSGPKVGLVTPQGHVIAVTRAETPLQFVGTHGVEQDPADWWTAIVDATRRLLAAEPDAAARLAGIGVTAQWSGTVAVDRDGRPLMNAVIWMDARGAHQLDAIGGAGPRVAGFNIPRILTWIRRSGGAPTPSGKDPIAHILHIRAAHPDVYADTDKFLEPKDYINLILTGRAAASYDSIALHWVTDNRDISRVRYDEKLLALSTLPRAKLPELHAAVDVLGPLLPEPAAALGVPAGLPVVVGTPDLHSAAVGSGAVEDFAGHLYVGTSSWLTCHVPFKKTDIFHNIASLPSALPGRYFIANEQETAGGCLEFLRTNILYPDDELRAGPAPDDLYRRLNAMAARVPAGSDGLVFLPWLNGERTPVEDHIVRGGFLNMSLQHTRAHMVRAVMEGVACNSRWLMETVERFAGTRFERLNAIGGGARSATLCQIYADVLDRPLAQVARPLEANVRGVGLVAALGLGLTTTADIGRQIEIARVFEPQPANRARYDDLYTIFRRCYKRTRGLFSKLHA